MSQIGVFVDVPNTLYDTLPFQPYIEKDAATSLWNHFHHIYMQPKFQKFSPEEIRSQDYNLTKIKSMASNTSSLFGGGNSFSTPAPHGSTQGGFGSFGANTNTPSTTSSSAFGSQAAPTSSNNGTACGSSAGLGPSNGSSNVFGSSNTASSAASTIFGRLSSNPALVPTSTSPSNIQQTTQTSAGIFGSVPASTSPSVFSTIQPSTVQQEEAPFAVSKVGTKLFKGVSALLPEETVPQNATTNTMTTVTSGNNKLPQGSAGTSMPTRPLSSNSLGKRTRKIKNTKNTTKKDPNPPNEEDEDPENNPNSDVEEEGDCSGSDEEDDDDDTGTDEKPAPTLKIDVNPLLKPPRAKALFETHIFTLDIDSCSITNYITLYPKYTPKNDNNDSLDGFQDAVCKLLNFSGLELDILDQVLSIVADVTEKRGESWYNKDIRAWRNNNNWYSDKKEGKGVRVRVLFTLFRDEIDFDKKKETSAFQRRSYGLEEEKDIKYHKFQNGEMTEEAEEKGNLYAGVSFKLNDKKVTLNDVDRVPDSPVESIGGLSDSAYKAR